MRNFKKKKKWARLLQTIRVAGGALILSPFVTVWAEGNYYILVRRDDSETLEHFRIDHLKDIVLLDQGVDMIFGGFNAGQYAKKYIYQRGESG